MHTAALLPVALVNTEGLMEGFVTTGSEATESFIELVTAGIMNVINLNFEIDGTSNYLSAYFTFFNEIGYICMIIAYSLLILITVMNLFKGMLGPLSEAENPWALLARALICAGAIAVAPKIMNMLYTPGQLLIESTKELFQDAKDAPASGIFKKFFTEQVNGWEWLGSAIMRIVFGIVLIFFNLIIFINYIKLALECLERWVVLAALYYTSPLAFSMGASKSTIGIFRAWIRMVISSMVVLCLNMGFVYLYLTARREIQENGFISMPLEEADVGIFSGFFVYSWVLIAILKTGQRLDQYMASLGISTAQVGAGLGSEIFAAARTVTLTVAMTAMRGGMKKMSASAGATAGRNPDGSQKIINSGIKPTSGEMKSALHGKGPALQGGGNAAAASEMLKGATNKNGDPVFEGAKIFDSSTTAEGCMTVDMMNKDGTYEQCKLFTTKPEGMESTPIQLEDGSTLYMVQGPAAISGCDFRTYKDLQEHMTPTSTAEIFNEKGEEVVDVGMSPGGVYNQEGQIYGASFLERESAEHGGVSGEVTTNDAGVTIVPFNDGYQAEFYQKDNTRIKESAAADYQTICDGSGTSYGYAKVYSPSIAEQLGASERDISQGYVNNMPAPMVNKISQQLNIPAASLAPRMEIGNNGHSVMVSSQSADGKTTHYNIGNADAVMSNPRVKGVQREQVNTNSQGTSSSLKGNMAVVSGENRQSVSKAFVPQVRNTALIQECLVNQNKEASESMKRMARATSMSSDAKHQSEEARNVWETIVKRGENSRTEKTGRSVASYAHKNNKEAVPFFSNIDQGRTVLEKNM